MQSRGLQGTQPKCHESALFQSQQNGKELKRAADLENILFIPKYSERNGNKVYLDSVALWIIFVNSGDYRK